MSNFRCVSGCFFALATLLSACGGSVTDHVYWPARDVFHDLDYDSRKLDDKRWNHILILPRIMGPDYMPLVFHIVLMSKQNSSELYVDHIGVNDLDNPRRWKKEYSAEEMIRIDEPVSWTDYYSGGVTLNFDENSPETTLFGEDNYEVVVAFRENGPDSQLHRFHYRIVPRTRTYLIDR